MGTLRWCRPPPKHLSTMHVKTFLTILGLALMLSTSSAAPAPEPAPFTPEFVLGTLFGLYKYHLLSLAAGNNRGSVLGLSTTSCLGPLVFGPLSSCQLCEYFSSEVKGSDLTDERSIGPIVQRCKRRKRCNE